MSIHWGGRGAGHVSRWSVSTSGVPSLALNFLTTTSLDSRITFTRGSTGTFVGSNGLIQTAAINAPRFDYDPVTLAPKGLLIEEQRVNVLAYSEQFNNLIWAKANATVTANAAVAPDGTTTADKLIMANGISPTSASTDGATQYGVIGSNTYTVSIYAKASDQNTISFRENLAVGSFLTVNLDTGAITPSGGSGQFVTPRAVNVGNGWWRVSFVSPAGMIATNKYTIRTGQTGNGVAGIFIWGAQIEAGTFSSSYIPTVATAVTRNADLALMTGTNFSSWYNQTEGTFVISGDRFTTTNFSAFISANDSSTANEIYITQATSAAQAFIRSSAGAAGDMIGSTWNVNTVGNAALAYQLNNAGLSFNGGAVVSDTAVGIPTVNRLSIGVRGGGLDTLNGHIRSIAYYRTRLLNSQLQTLTQ